MRFSARTEGIAEIAAHSLHFVGALPRSPGRPAFEPNKNENADAGQNQREDGKSERPGESPARREGIRIHDVISPKKYRPPRPMDVKGGCSPQNIFGICRRIKRACARVQQIS